MGTVARDPSKGLPPIDLAEVRRTADLRAVISADLGEPKVIARKPHWYCPFHSDNNPSFYLFDDGRRWRCWPCNLTGDVLDYVMRRDNIGVIEAARKLAGEPSPSRKRKPTPRPAEPKPKAEPWRDPAWQATADRLIAGAEAALWSAEGRAVLAWLRARGLEDHTIRRFRLGYLPAEVRSGPGAHVRGVLIPWTAPESWPSAFGPGPSGPRWCGANVRRLAADPFQDLPEGVQKCKALIGSSRGHAYPLPDLTPGVPCLILEGEFDALLAWQELAHVVNVATVGGAGQPPKPEAAEALSSCPAWLIATDHDQAGDKGARLFRGIAPERCKRVWLPHGKDLTDFARRGGNPLGWIKNELTRIGI